MKTIYKSVYREVVSTVPRACSFPSAINPKDRYFGIKVGEIMTSEGIRREVKYIIYIAAGYRSPSMSLDAYYVQRSAKDVLFMPSIAVEQKDMAGHSDERMLKEVNGVMYGENKN